MDVAAGWGPQSKMLCGTSVLNIFSLKNKIIFTDSQLAAVFCIYVVNPHLV